MKNTLRTILFVILILLLATGCVRGGKRWQGSSSETSTPVPVSVTADSSSLPTGSTAQTPVPQGEDEFWQAWATLSAECDEWLAEPVPVSTEEVP